MEYFSINRYSYAAGPIDTAYISRPDKINGYFGGPTGPSCNVLYFSNSAGSTTYTRPPGKNHPLYNAINVPVINL